MGYAISNLNPIKMGTFSHLQNAHRLTIITDEPEEAINFGHRISFVSGYIVALNEKNSQQEVYEEFLSDVEFSWPINSNLSGSYAISILYENKIILANDVIRPYPFFYYINGDKFIFTDNLQRIKYFIEIELDSTGIAQRLWAPENSNIGSRTILQNVKRLLPGEKLTFDFLSFEYTQEFDNRLFSAIGEDKIDSKTIEAYLGRLKTEVNQLKTYNKPIDIALSGGLDSRTLLGVLNPNDKTTCFTYGPADGYESKVAHKLAKSKGFKFSAISDYSKYFPLKNEIIDVIRNTDPPYVMAWFEFLDNIPKEENILLHGDSCESLSARYIKRFSSRKDRKKNFFKHFLMNEPYDFEKANDESFDKWKSETIDRYLRNLKKNNLKSPIFRGVSKEIVLKETTCDLEELFKRIEAHSIKFVELYDELFTWYTHSRLPMGKQIVHCNYQFKAISPTMGSGVLILTSNIHPNSRLNYRFIGRLFKEKDYRKLNRIPKSQAPLISGNASKILGFLMWGFRSTVDQLLIQKMIRKKNPKLRYRLFKGLNWVEVYQPKNTMEKFDSYFQNNYLGNEIYKETKDTLKSRIELSSWPLTNYDLMAPAILNLEIESLMEQTKSI